MVNIGSAGKGDEHYRYKRNLAEIKLETAHGGQTRITNLQTISEQLTPPQLAPLEFKKMLSKVKKSLILDLREKFGLVKEEKDGIVMIRGSRSLVDIEKIIEKYIEDILLCRRCKRPEWVLGERCLACGVTKKELSSSSSRSSKIRPEASEDSDDDEGADSIGDKVAELIRKLDVFKETDRAKSLEMKKLLGKLLEQAWDCETEEALEQLEKGVSDLIVHV